MAKKRKYTGNLLCDFPTHAVLEVLIKDKWYRVTSNDFRSFNGSRRITTTIQPAQAADFSNCEKTTVNYVGPVYLHGTNIEASPSSDTVEGIVPSDLLENRLFVSKKRK